MQKQSPPKLRIKNLPRFIVFSAISLILIILAIMTLFFLTTKLTETFNAQRQILQTSSTVNTAETNTTKATNSKNIKETLKKNPAAQANDPLADIKSRLRTDDTEGIKVIFLTFDDGPTERTGEVLDLLNTYNVKGTFFTTLHDGESAKAMYNRIVDEGHTLANHTSSHDYSLYNNPDDFYADVDKLDQYQMKITGLEQTSHVFRFPGGSLNANETCALGIVDQGWNYSDWNVSSGDGCADPPPSEVIAQNVINGCHDHDVSVVLCHAELKEQTRAALPTVIETLQDEGYTFLPMENDYTYPRQLQI
ncbi:putative polysaccharide deacetylase [Acetobacterium woodii DSM 1030]|uniref:Putative polysaccharide deacetylase n=2 Tax=Acetobacterium woodii TaxID=33952 RepID=H6LKD3_ACEWD|nr:putative polysaccharide deacetylase [Acetobacterium woodii DSM 1030]